MFKILVFFFSISNLFKKPHHSHHFATQGSLMILWIELCRKPKKAPLNFGYHDVMRTAPIDRYDCAMSWHGMPTSRRRKGRYLIECQLAQKSPSKVCAVTHQNLNPLSTEHPLLKRRDLSDSFKRPYLSNYWDYHNNKHTIAKVSFEESCNGGSGSRSRHHC